MKNDQKKTEWQALIAGQKRSGETVRGYCRKRGISEKNFYNWRQRLRSTAEVIRDSFVELKATAAQGLVIQTPGGYRLEVPQGAESGYVGAILKEVMALK